MIYPSLPISQGHSNLRGSSLNLRILIRDSSLVAKLMLALAEVNSRRVVSVNEHLLESEAEEIIGGLLDVLPVLSDELAGGLGEDKINLFKSLILSFRHKEQLVEPPIEDRLACFHELGEPALGIIELTQQMRYRRRIQQSDQCS